MIEVVALVASAGGLDALSAVLRELPADLPAAVVIQQHLGGQGSVLPAILERRTGRTVVWAEDGAFLEPGSVLITPPRRRLEVLPDGCCAVGPTEPAVLDRPHDRLLTSLANSYGRRVLTVVLTGMGRDGAAGVRALRAAGAVVIAQSEDTAEQPSMPLAAVEAGADPVLALSAIGRVVAAMVRGAPVLRSGDELNGMHRAGGRLPAP